MSPARSQNARTTGGGAGGPGESARGRRREAEVLDAATKVFHAKSYADSSVQDVADELGILKGSLYHYIRTKEDLLAWLVEDVHDDVARIIQEVSAVEGLAPLERLELYVREQVKYNALNLPRVSVYHHDAEQLSAEPLAALMTRRRADERVVTDMIAAAQEQGDVSTAIEARVLKNNVFATMVWVYRWYKPSGRLSPDGLADACARFVMAGLRGVGHDEPE